MRACLVALLLVVAGCDGGDLEDRRRPAELLIGERIAGTWLGRFEIDALDLGTSSFITTYHADGTAITVSDSGSVHHVLWEANGPRGIRWTLLHYVRDADGTLTGISRTRGSAEFDDRFERYDGSFRVELYEPEVLLDPLDPNRADVAPAATTEGTVFARRLRGWAEGT